MHKPSLTTTVIISQVYFLSCIKSLPYWTSFYRLCIQAYLFHTPTKTKHQVLLNSALWNMKGAERLVCILRNNASLHTSGVLSYESSIVTAMLLGMVQCSFCFLGARNRDNLSRSVLLQKHFDEKTRRWVSKARQISLAFLIHAFIDKLHPNWLLQIWLSIHNTC